LANKLPLKVLKTKPQFNTDLLYSVAEATNIFGLIVYCAGMIFIVGALAWANYADHLRDKRRQSAK
jgi:hypothetical protein